MESTDTHHTSHRAVRRTSGRWEVNTPFFHLSSSQTDVRIGAVISFFIGPLLWLWSLFVRVAPNKKPPVTRTILHKLASYREYSSLFSNLEYRSSGVLKPGEMCLVLGCPGSGCSTFLKAISNQREDYASVSGNVLYAGIDAEEMAKHYKGEVVFNQEGVFRQFHFGNSMIHTKLTISRQMTSTLRH